MDETEKKIKTTLLQMMISGDHWDSIINQLLPCLQEAEIMKLSIYFLKMIKSVPHFPDYQFVLAGVKNLPDELYKRIIGNNPVRLINDKTYEILYMSEAALVTSGTATLETALFNVPQVVCFKGDFFSMLIAWAVIKGKVYFACKPYHRI